MVAVGVARPSAQGQEITSTDTPAVSAEETSPVSSSQTITVISAMAITTGTNTPLTLSANRAMGALELTAFSTSRIIPASTV